MGVTQAQADMLAVYDAVAIVCRLDQLGVEDAAAD
jgi:hypothetical protein